MVTRSWGCAMTDQDIQRIDEAVKMHFAARTTAMAPVSVRRAVRAVRARLKGTDIAEDHNNGGGCPICPQVGYSSEFRRKCLPSGLVCWGTRLLLEHFSRMPDGARWRRRDRQSRSRRRPSCDLKCPWLAQSLAYRQLHEGCHTGDHQGHGRDVEDLSHAR